MGDDLSEFSELSESIVSTVSSVLSVDCPALSFNPDDKFQLLTEIDKLSSIDEIDQVVFSIARYYNYDFFATVSVFNTVANKRNMIYHVERSSNWTEHYRRKGYFLSDPTFQYSRTTCTPFDWNIHNYNNKVKSQLNEKQNRIVTEAIDFGLTQVVSIPVHINFENYGLFRFVNINQLPKDSREIFELTSQTSMLLGFIFEKFVSLYRVKYNGNSPDCSITNREKEVLHSISSGMTPTQISDSLRISEHTVRKHIKSIRQKFGVSTITHAVVKAIQRNDIIV